jgi:histidinol-phosphatase (PHP family)
MRMMELGGFDILGHADKIHHNAQCYHPGLLQESWYEKLVNDYMDLVVEKNYLLEINTKAYQNLGTFYPNERYFSAFHKRGIKVLVNSDAHYPDCINNGRLQALSALQASGYDTVMELHHGVWEPVPILIC